MRFATRITMTCEAPDGTDAHQLARIIAAAASAALMREACENIRPNIVSVSANGKAITFKERKHGK